MTGFSEGDIFHPFLRSKKHKARQPSPMSNRVSTIASKINVTTKDVYLPISKLHSILAVANLLSHKNISQICYCGQIPLHSAAVNCSFSDNLTLLRVTFILLAMVHSAKYDSIHATYFNSV